MGFIIAMRRDIIVGGSGEVRSRKGSWRVRIKIISPPETLALMDVGACRENLGRQVSLAAGMGLPGEALEKLMEGC